MNEFIISTKGSLWESSYPEHKGERQGSRKGSRKGEAGDTDQSQLFIYLYEQDTTDNNTLRNMWNSLSSDEQDYILFQFGESRKDFEESFLDSHKGSRKGSRKGLKYNWDGVPFEEIEFRLDSPVIDEDIYSMSDEELLQFAEDHGLRPEMFTNELPDWAQRDGSRKGSRKGKRMIHYGIGDYDVSDIDRYIAEGNVKKGNVNGDKHQIITYLMNEKGYSENDAWLTYDAWATHDNMVYGIPPHMYEKYINKYREMVGLPPLEDSHKGSRKGSSEDVWERFMGYENASDLQTFNKFCQVFQSVTGHPFDSDYGEEFDNENLAQQIVTKLDNEL